MHKILTSFCRPYILQFKKKVLTLVHTKTLKMTDDVLSVRYTPDGKLLAIALLDSTVKVFYQDTLKFFLSLYGHKVSCWGFVLCGRGASKLITRPF